METMVNNKGALTKGEKLDFRHEPFVVKQEPKTPKEVNRFAERQKKLRLFIVEDDPLYSKALELSISGNMGSISINSFETGEECLQHMKMKPAIVILDYYLNSKKPFAHDGLKVLKEIKHLYPKTKVI